MASDAYCTGEGSLSLITESDDIVLKHFEDIVEEKGEPEQLRDSASSAKSLFAVTSAVVRRRIQSALVPSGAFFRGGPPDLYGPVWVSATLCLVLSGAMGFPVQSLILLIYIYGALFLVPLGSYYVTSRENSTLSLPDLVCSYGYSNSVLVPLSMSWASSSVYIRNGPFAAGLLWSVFSYFHIVRPHCSVLSKSFILPLALSSAALFLLVINII